MQAASASPDILKKNLTLDILGLADVSNNVDKCNQVTSTSLWKDTQAQSCATVLFAPHLVFRDDWGLLRLGADISVGKCLGSDPLTYYFEKCTLYMFPCLSTRRLSLLQISLHLHTAY